MLDSKRRKVSSVLDGGWHFLVIEDVTCPAHWDGVDGSSIHWCSPLFVQNSLYKRNDLSV